MDHKILVAANTMHHAVNMLGEAVEPFVPFSVRSPQLLKLKDGTQLFFYGAKYNSQLDEEPCVVILIRSKDGGKTWGDARMLSYEGVPYNLMGVPIYDEINDVLVYFARSRQWKKGCEEDRVVTEGDQVKGLVDERFWVTKSYDGGLTWSRYTEIFLDAPADWRVRHCPTPANGIQLLHQKDKTKNGRLIVPANHIGANLDGKNEFGSHLLVSDDFGNTWRMGAVQDFVGGNECLLTELQDGTLLLNCRGQATEPSNLRIQSISRDGGDTLVEAGTVETLFDPCCHGGFTSMAVDGEECVFCALPTGELGEPWSCLGVMGRWSKREKLMLYMSRDGGKSYKPVHQLSPADEFAAYSALCPTQEGNLICVWESGPQDDLYRNFQYAIVDPKVYLSEQ